MRREAARCGLICSDVVATRRAVRAMMHGRGIAEVAETETATDLLRHAERWHPDVIVVDLALAGELGVRLVGRLRAAVPHACIVVLSSFPDLDRAACEAGASRLVDERDLRGLDQCLAGVGDDPGCRSRDHDDAVSPGRQRVEKAD